MRSGLHICSFFLLTGLFFCTCIYPVENQKYPIEKINADIYKELTRLKTFRFTLWYRTDMPVHLTARYTGQWEGPDKELWDGFLNRDGVKQQVRLRAKNDVQFILTDSGWQVQPRGLETQIFSQLEQMFIDVQLNYTGQVHNNYCFEFKPRMTLIDPLRLKDITGELEVDRTSGLPVRIYLTNAQKSAEWELRLSHFNRAGKVQIPFVAATKLYLFSPHCLHCKVRKKFTRMFINRLDRIRIDYRLKWRGNCLQVQLERVLSRAALELLSTRGKVELWRGRWLGLKETAMGKVLGVGIDPASRVELLEKIGENSSLISEIDSLTSQKQKLIVEAGGGNQNLDSKYILLIDDRVIGITDDVRVFAGKDEGHKTVLIFSDIAPEEVLPIISALINSQPLPFSPKFKIQY
uniref:Uncharacterized protein n=1 Tax=candidate division WOR-3 bacterium TaxID=2052148 RepID=A0A7V3V032_UNCW3